ncbi:MAG: penicillin-binding protein activator [Candidatus Zixiibacteriota bacterium]|nr:MAG: penicillin-binding protein activator [candidate division Zixibacteria bacterium]
MIASKFYTVLALILAGILLTDPAAAENLNDSPDAVALYARGKRLMREKNWFDAADVFQELEGRFPGSPNIDLFVFNRAKARFHLGEHSEAAAGFNYFVSRFPESPVIAHAYHFLGNALYLKGDINRAVRAYLTAYRLSRNPELTQLVSASLLGAFRNASSLSLGAADFEDLPVDRACALIKPLSEIYLQRGESSRAADLLAICGDKIDSSAISSPSKGSAGIQIAMVLPLSGELQTFGQEIYNGAVIAAETYREETGQVVRLASFDSKGDPIEAARIIGQLSNSAGTNVVIGPLTSDEAMVASAALACSSLPMIAPAATQAGLTRLSSSSFQLSPNIELEGIALADYAVKTLGADSAAVISSTAADHLRMTRAFTDRFERLGGKVVAIEYYRQRDKDFGIYIRDVKSVLLGQPQDSTFFINANGDTLDLDVVPAYIDCLFVPGDSRQLRQLLPQIHFYNLNGVYLGSDGWGDESVYSLGDDITKRAVFGSPFLEGRKSEQYLKLAAAYDIRFGSRPQRLSALGYDAVSLVLAASPGNNATRDDILRRLREISSYEGASGVISFGEYRENIEMPLYRIESERPVLIETTEPAAESSLGVEP